LLTEFLRAIPKVEIHCHLLGTVRQATFHDLAVKAKAPLSREEIDAFYLRGESRWACFERCGRSMRIGSGSPADFAVFLRREQADYEKIVQAAGIKE
jgi:hypothetical protein